MPPSRKPLKRCKGFTLAELLIALAILGVIATFTIPKVLTAQTNAQNNANAHEAASMVAAAYQQALGSGSWTTNTNGSALSQYMNYLSVLPTGNAIDQTPGTGSTACVNNGVCLQLHNGGVLYFRNNEKMGGTATTNGILIYFDPDGVYSGSSADSSSKSVAFVLFYNGQITSNSNSTFTSSDGSWSLRNDPAWFTW